MSSTTIDVIENRGKDRLPHDTVHHIRQILRDLDIFTIENPWVSTPGRFYSLRLTVAGTNIGTNGKGVTPEYALASAYGEFMERFQNRILHTNCDFGPDMYAQHDFLYAPDEKYLSIDEFLALLPGEWKTIYKPFDGTISDLVSCLKQFVKLNPSPFPDKLVCLPYFNHQTGDLFYFPGIITEYFYGSNGMAAGNTPEEAMVQGLCEIFERYVQKKMLIEDITPPTIPDTYLQQFKKLYEMKRYIESEGGMKIIVKDASLGKKLPAAAAIFINVNDNTYFVKFGAHPVFEIALERCFTELFQGRTIREYFGYAPFNYYLDEEKKSISAYKNTERIAQDGIGLYSNSIFCNDGSYPFHSSPAAGDTFNSTRDMLKACIRLLDDLGVPLLCRDVSFLGFPSFHVVIPGMSEIFHMSKRYYRNVSMKRKARQILRSGSYREAEDDLRYLIDFLEAFYRENQPVGDSSMIGFPSTENFPLKKITFELFLFMAYFCVGDFHAAHKNISKYIDYLVSIGNTNREAMKYYRCVRDFTAMKVEKKTERNILDYLGPVYGEELVTSVIQDFVDTRTVFENTPALCCWDCGACPVSEQCRHEIVKKIQLTLKDRLVQNPIDQLQCAKLFTG